MGCCSSQPKPPTPEPIQPTPPEGPTVDQKLQLEELRNLWAPGSIWTGTIKIKGKEKPWEIHVKRESTPNRILAKRVANFAQGTYVDADKVELEHAWEDLTDEQGNHLGFKEIITFSWEDDEYRLFADTMDGILDVKERRIRGLVVHNETGHTGNVDFTRVMCVKKYGDDSVIHTVSFDWQDNDPRTKRVRSALEKANKTLDEEKGRLTGVLVQAPLAGDASP